MLSSNGHGTIRKRGNNHEAIARVIVATTVGIIVKEERNIMERTVVATLVKVERL